MPWHTFTLGGSVVEGYRVTPEGAVVDFRGTVRNTYDNLERATAAARRKYRDSSINVLKVSRDIQRYRVDLEQLLQIAEKID